MLEYRNISIFEATYSLPCQGESKLRDRSNYICRFHPLRIQSEQTVWTKLIVSKFLFF